MSRDGFHSAAWLAWAAGAATVVLATTNPAVPLAVLVALGAVAAAFRARGPEGRSFGLMLRIGLAFTALRAVLFGLTGHTGDTTLFVLPTAAFPHWLGGFSIGGRVTAEVVAESGAEGLRIAALLACAGVFLSAVETYRVLRLVPRFLFEAGLVVGIALTFVPTLLRSASEVRDAQRLRGHRFRGVRSLRALVVPVLSGALERSLTLAASMDARGYGRDESRETPARALVLAGLLALSGGGAFVLMRGGAVAVAVAAVGSCALAGGLAMLSRTAARTRLRGERFDRWDLALLTSSLFMLAVGVATRALPASAWTAYPAVHVPGLDPRLVALAFAPLAPLVLDGARSLRLRRAGRHHAELAEAAP